MKNFRLLMVASTAFEVGGFFILILGTDTAATFAGVGMILAGASIAFVAIFLRSSERIKTVQNPAGDYKDVILFEEG